MPIVIYNTGTFDRPILLSDVGRRDYVWGPAIYKNAQWQYVSPGDVAVLKSTSDVEMSIAHGVIRRYVDLGVFTVDYRPYILTNVGGLEYNIVLDSLTPTSNITETFRIMNIGDDPVSGGSNIHYSITNLTDIASGPAILCSEKTSFNITSGGSAFVVSENMEDFTFTIGAPPQIVSTVAGPYTLVPGSNTIRIQYSNKNYPLEFIALPTGVQTTMDIANIINGTFPGLASATAPPNGFLQLTGLTSGSNISIKVGSQAESSTVNETLGFDAAGEYATGIDDVDYLDLEIDGTRNNVPLVQGVRTATDVINDINAVFAGTASVSSKRVMVSSLTKGVTSSVKVYPSPANTVLGFEDNQADTGYAGNYQFTLEVGGTPYTINLTTGATQTNGDIVNDIVGAGIPNLTAYTQGDSFCLATTASGIGNTLGIVPNISGSTAFAQLGFNMGDFDQGHSAVQDFVFPSPSSGFINQVQWATIEASLDANAIITNLSPGSYIGSLIVTADAGCFNNPIQLPVILNIAATS